MISEEKIWIVTVPIVILNCTLPIYLFFIYQEVAYAILFAIMVPASFGYAASIGATTLETVLFPAVCGSEPDKYENLLPVGRIIAGFLFVLAFAGDDIIYQYHTVNEPWFWCGIISFVSFWIVGIMITRYRTIQNKIQREAEVTTPSNGSGMDEQLVDETDQ